MSPAARAHDISRELPVRRARHQPVFWHHAEPRLQIAQLDPAHARLRFHFPRTWKRLLRVQALLNAVTVLDLPVTVLTDQQYFDQAAPLLRTVGQELSRIADEEQNASVRLAADQLSSYTESGRWPFAGPAPADAPGEPWIYVGPAPAVFSTTGEALSERHLRLPLCLMVAAPHDELQAELAHARARLGTLRHAAASILDEDVAAFGQHDPDIAVADLLLAGGVMLSGHGDLLPPLPPRPVTVFANVRRHWLRQALASAPEQAPDDIEVSLRRSLRRSVGHLAAHQWRRTALPGDSEPAPGLKSFEYHGFEEAYASLISVLAATHCATASESSEPLRDFVAELLPYAGLPHQAAADTVAALLILGRLQQSSSTRRSPLNLQSVVAARPAFEALVRYLHAALWGGDMFSLAQVRGAFAAGVQYQSRLTAQSPEPPVELGWTFG
ncbi:hypothetical protein ABTZ93_28370 [Streptomyces sp. NPDC097941]|uniref:hypothetical protein n=1 Tax=Streptomyces sp. NPDC097941 TaxID=3155685 RepID=UPI00332968AD